MGADAKRDRAHTLLAGLGRGREAPREEGGLSWAVKRSQEIEEGGL